MLNRQKHYPHREIIALLYIIRKCPSNQRTQMIAFYFHACDILRRPCERLQVSATIDDGVPEPRRLGLRRAKKRFRNEARWQTNTENN
jgi:hypothetical protein